MEQQVKIDTYRFLMKLSDNLHSLIEDSECLTTADKLFRIAHDVERAASNLVAGESVGT